MLDRRIPQLSKLRDTVLSLGGAGYVQSGTYTDQVLL
jgi:hypothetical protein